MPVNLTFAYHQLTTLLQRRSINFLLRPLLGACKVALTQGRFTFRHDKVLRIIISNIRSSIKHEIFSCYFKATHKYKIYKKGNQSKKQKFFSQWDIISAISLDLVRGSRWHFFLSTSHSLYWTKARHNYLF